MKNILKVTLGLILFLSLNTELKAQSGMEIPKHEINYNLANTLIITSVEFGYEYFIDYDQSIGMKILINDRRNFKHEKSKSKNNTHAFRLNYTYYFGQENPGSGLYIQPFLKYRMGDFKENIGDFDEKKTNMDAFIVGIGGGYQWNFSNSFVLGPFVNFGRNFSKEVKERFSAFDFNAGFNIGYRF